MTRMEKFANNYTTIVIARVAMTVTPMLLSFFIWLFWQAYTTLNARVDAAEQVNASQASVIQDHESRLIYGRAAREALAADTKEQFGAINTALKDMQTQVIAVNGNIIRLQTTFENRLPPIGGGTSQQ